MRWLSGEEFFRHERVTVKTFKKPPCKAAMGRDKDRVWKGIYFNSQPHPSLGRAYAFPTCTVMAAFLVIVWYMPMKATLLSKS